MTLFCLLIIVACNIFWICLIQSWWRHQNETFSALLAICTGNPPVTGEFPAQRPVTPSFDAFFDLRLNKRLSKQWWGWWLETPLHLSWRHCNGLEVVLCILQVLCKLQQHQKMFKHVKVSLCMGQRIGELIQTRQLMDDALKLGLSCFNIIQEKLTVFPKYLKHFLRYKKYHGMN